MHLWIETRLSTVTKASAQMNPWRRWARGRSRRRLNSATIMTGTSGTGVPGMGGSNASLSSFSGQCDVPNYLGGFR